MKLKQIKNEIKIWTVNIIIIYYKFWKKSNPFRNITLKLYEFINYHECSVQATRNAIKSKGNAFNLQHAKTVNKTAITATKDVALWAILDAYVIKSKDYTLS